MALPESMNFSQHGTIRIISLHEISVVGVDSDGCITNAGENDCAVMFRMILGTKNRFDARIGSPTNTIEIATDGDVWYLVCDGKLVSSRIQLDTQAQTIITKYIEDSVGRRQKFGAI